MAEFEPLTRKGVYQDTNKGSEPLTKSGVFQEQAAAAAANKFKSRPLLTLGVGA